MASKTIALKNSFGKAVRIARDDFSHVLIWPDIGIIRFWRKGDYSHIGSLECSPDTVLPDAEQVFHRLRAEGIDLLRIDGGPDPVKTGQPGTIAFLRPDTIQYFEDDLPEAAESAYAALTVCQIPFHIGEDEKADFKQALLSKTPADDWVSFSPDLSGAFRSARGHYAFRKSMIIDMFANSRDNLLAIQTHDRYRSFVPMENPDAQIDAVAATLPQLVKSDAPSTAYPLYYAPAAYPPDRRHHVNIILRR